MIKRFDEFLNESKLGTNTFDEIIGTDGSVLASCGYFNKPELESCYRYYFEFKSVKDVKNFFETSDSAYFWKEIYDYDPIPGSDNDFAKIDANMKRFRNICIGKKLYVYTPNKSDKSEMFSRCEKAAKAYTRVGFKSHGIVNDGINESMSLEDEMKIWDKRANSKFGKLLSSIRHIVNGYETGEKDEYGVTHTTFDYLCASYSIGEMNELRVVKNILYYIFNHDFATIENDNIVSDVKGLADDVNQIIKLSGIKMNEVETIHNNI